MAIKGLISIAGVAALLAAPGAADARKPAPTPAKSHGQAKAYGKYCQGESKKHVAGETGTAFSRCVKAAAKLHQDKEEQDSEATTS